MDTEIKLYTALYRGFTFTEIMNMCAKLDIFFSHNHIIKNIEVLDRNKIRYIQNPSIEKLETTVELTVSKDYEFLTEDIYFKYPRRTETERLLFYKFPKSLAWWLPEYPK